jgi:hypothetical protein
MQGGLSTIDREFGWINNIHHDIGTHVVHHLFPQIPHYNLIEAHWICSRLPDVIPVICFPHIDTIEETEGSDILA